MILDGKENHPLLQRGDILFLPQGCSLNKHPWESNPRQKSTVSCFSVHKTWRDTRTRGKLSPSQTSSYHVYTCPGVTFKKETPNSLGGHKEELVLLVDHKGSKTSPYIQHYVTSAFLFPWMLQRLMSTVVKSGLWHSNDIRNRNKTSWLTNIFFLPHHTASVWEESLYLINGSNYRFWFLVLSLRILYEPQIGNTQNVCLLDDVSK